MKFCITAILGFLLLAGTTAVQALDAQIILLDTKGKKEVRTIPLVEKDSVQYLTIPAKSIPAGFSKLEVHHPWATAMAGDDGFYVFANGMYGTFQKRANGQYRNPNVIMPMFGVKTPQAAMTVILTGFCYEADFLVDLKNDVYKVYPRFDLQEAVPYEDIVLEFHLLPDKEKVTYSDIAKVYRQYQLNRGACIPLKERTKNNPALQYAANSMEIRVRLGWKPVPSPVKEQNAENEPPMKAVITFNRFVDIVKEFKKQGVNRAEFCLVGWNIGGHDGRYPQIFPPDERLGGETKLRSAIDNAKKDGFQIVCHTNNSDAYRASQIGGLWDEGFLLRKKDGTLNTYTTWGGGNMYETCPKCMYERFVKNDLITLKNYGFYGLHYIDVFSTVNPRTCWSKEHPLTKKDYAFWTNKIFAEAKKQLGGLGSEGGFDYCISNLDYALYISFYKPGSKLNPLIERHVPIWQIVYNGIVLNNPYTDTVNYTIKEPVSRLKLVEFGGRPIFYFYSKFKHSGSNWMGDSDITCGTEEELVNSVKKIKEGYDEFEKLKYLQYEFMESHDMLEKNLFRTVFSDGTVIITNYNNGPRTWQGKKIEALNYIVYKK